MSLPTMTMKLLVLPTLSFAYIIIFSISFTSQFGFFFYFFISWFHGPISNGSAQQLLSKETPGTFLVRFSTSTEYRGAFALALVSTDGSINNLRIMRTPEGKTKFWKKYFLIF